MRKALHSCGLRFRMDTPVGLPGSPDIRFARARVAVFVDGCFWHGCPQHGSHPKTNAAFWSAKIARNRQRDLAVDAALQRLGWSVVRVWEHEVNQDVVSVALAIWACVRSREP
jgi:DNA mismatch endonuclease (patch repair protein)